VATYISVRNKMMSWIPAHSDCVGVITGVTLPRPHDKVKRRTTVVFGALLSQYLLLFSTGHSEASFACP